MPNRCVAPGCKVNYDSCKEKCSMFAAPKEEERRLLWQRANPRKDFVLKPSHYLCEKHFHEENIVRKITHKDQSDKIIAQSPPTSDHGPRSGSTAENHRRVWHCLPGSDQGIELGCDDQTTLHNRTTLAGTFFRGSYGNYLDTGTYI